MDTTSWIAAREMAGLRRVRLAGLALALVLFAAAAWLGWREMGLSRLPAWTRQAETAYQTVDTILRLKMFSRAVFQAKVKHNALLVDITGNPSLGADCVDTWAAASGLVTDSCAQAWEDALRRVWASAFGRGGPPVPPELLRDVWGAPYVLDQSEFFCGRFGSWCPHDVVISVGPDGKHNTPDDYNETIPQHLGPGLAGQ